MNERQQFARPMALGRLDTYGGRLEQTEGNALPSHIGTVAADHDVWQDFIRMLRRSADHPG